MTDVDLLIIHALNFALSHARKAGRSAVQRLGELGLIEDGALAVQDGYIVAVGPTDELAAHCVRPHRQLTRQATSSSPVLLIRIRTSCGRATARASSRCAWRARRTWRSWRPAAASCPPSAPRAPHHSTSLSRRPRPGSRGCWRTARRLSEAKTGYGLETAAELKMLDAIHRLQAEQPVELVPTFLGAHAVPAEYKDRPDAYVDLLVNEMLPSFQISTLRLSNSPLFCDVFCEDGAFTLEQTRRILTRAKELGFRPQDSRGRVQAAGRLAAGR